MGKVVVGKGVCVWVLGLRKGSEWIDVWCKFEVFLFLGEMLCVVGFWGVVELFDLCG